MEDGKTKQSKWISGKSGHLNIRVAGGRAVVLGYGYSPFDFFICHALSAIRYPLSAIRYPLSAMRHSSLAIREQLGQGLRRVEDRFESRAITIVTFGELAPNDTIGIDQQYSGIGYAVGSVAGLIV